MELAEVANVQQLMPADYLDESKTMVTQAFYDYALPLIGEPLPQHATLEDDEDTEMTALKRAILVVLDGVGAGANPDAHAYGDEGASSLEHCAQAIGGLIAAQPGQHWPGQYHAHPGNTPYRAASGAYGRMAEAAAGKDSTTGHWEMTGVVLHKAIAHLSAWLSPRMLSQPLNRLSGARSSATRPHPAPRSSKNWARSMCAPVAHPLYLCR